MCRPLLYGSPLRCPHFRSSLSPRAVCTCLFRARCSDEVVPGFAHGVDAAAYLGGIVGGDAVDADVVVVGGSNDLAECRDDCDGAVVVVAFAALFVLLGVFE